MAKLDWQLGIVKAIKPETPRVKTFVLKLPNWKKHKAGQHYELRLRAPDGYVAQRNYSVASEPERRGEIELTVEKVEDGEVSSYLHEVVEVGDKLEIRGPIGGYFVWRSSYDKPLLLIAGGSGIVPLRSMLKHHQAAKADNPVRLLYSSRSFADIIYREELDQLSDSPNIGVHHTLTRQVPNSWTGLQRRVDKDMLDEMLTSLSKPPRCYVCGPTNFVELVARYLSELGIPELQIRTERFGPTGA